jgi:serine/threonine-protein kinase
MSADVLAGEPFGKYVLVKRIAMGGMAEVCLARLQGTAGFNKLVVIKQVLPAFAESPQFVEMFLDEGRLAAKLSHPNIAQTFELGEENGRHYLAMEYVPGESLYAILRRCREQRLLLPMGCALRVQMQLLEALEYAHSLNDESGTPLHLVHRDITPSNVMVTQQGAIKLLDFGIARAATQLHRTEVGRVKGKAGYMAPEQCRSGAVDHRADVYGAGAVLYLMATGVKPFEHLSSTTDLLTQMNAMMEGSFLPPHQLKNDINPELERIILKAMALRPDDRYQSAGDMLAALEQFAGKVGVFPSARELGEFVKKLFPPKPEDAVDLTREPSSSRATPAPMNEKPATSDYPSVQGAVQDATSQPGRRRHSSIRPAEPVLNSTADTVGANDEPETDDSVEVAAPPPPPRRAPPPQLIAVAAGGAAMLVLGIALALKSGAPKVLPDPPVSQDTDAAAPQVPHPAAAVVEAAAQPPVAPVQDADATAMGAPERGAPGAQTPKKVGSTREAREPIAKAAHEVQGAREPQAKAAAPAHEAQAGKEPKDTGSKPAPARDPQAAAKKKAGPPLAPGKGGATGVLLINAYPWAKVTLKGRELGVTPLKVSLPPGDYPIELENPALNIKRTVKLTVKEGAETTHFEKME